MGQKLVMDTDKRKRIVAKYEAGGTMVAIAAEEGISHPVVARLLREDRVAIRTPGKRVLSPDVERRIPILYREGNTMKEIAHMLGCSKEPVKRVLAEAGMRPRVVQCGHSALTPSLRRKIVSLYKKGLSRHKIGVTVGLWTPVVERVLNEEGFALRDDRKRRAANNPLWRGGRHLAGGYVRAYVAPDSPFASMCGSRSMVFEHRLVMAQHLGRPLFPYERVHHKNGVKTDNRIENLELWEESHPPGQRVDEAATPHCPTCTCRAHAVA